MLSSSLPQFVTSCSRVIISNCKMNSHWNLSRRAKALSAMGKSKVKSGVVQSLLSLGDIRNFEWNEWWRHRLVTELDGWGTVGSRRHWSRLRHTIHFAQFVVRYA